MARWWSALGWDGRWSLAALAACLLLGAAVMLAGGTDPLDDVVQRAASEHPALQNAGGWASYLLPRIVQLVLVAALVLLALAGEWAAVLAIVAVFALADAPTSGLKLLFARERPPGAFLRSYAYPSGHATGASSQWGFLFLVAVPRLLGSGRPSRRMAAAWALFGGLGALARVAEGEHWLTDVAGGFLWGAALALAASRLSRVRWRRPSDPPQPAGPPAADPPRAEPFVAEPIKKEPPVGRPADAMRRSHSPVARGPAKAVGFPACVQIAPSALSRDRSSGLDARSARQGTTAR